MKRRMKNSFIVLSIVVLALSAMSFKTEVGSIVPDFALRNVDNKLISTADYKNAKGMIVIFTCNHCPFAKLYTDRMNALSKKYSAMNVPLLAINSMDTLVYEEESFDKMKLKAKSDAFTFPYLQDGAQVVGKQFSAEHTPTAYVVWKENGQWKIKYKGSIDDNGEQASKANSFVAKAVDELLQNKSVTKAVTESFGCKIFYRK